MRKVLKACAVLALMFVFLCSIGVVFAQNQEFITESECESRFQNDPITLEANLEANLTVVIPTEGESGRADSFGRACTGNRWWYALLMKKVKSKDGKWLDDALVTVSVPGGVKVKAHWWDSWTTGPCSVSRYTQWGFALFWFKWYGSSSSIEITITVSKDGYSTITEDMTIEGSTWWYYPNCKLNELSPPPSVPEFSLMTPLAASICTSVYIAMRRRRK